MGIKTRFCRGCNFEYKDKCPNEQRIGAPKHKDGTFKMIYCGVYRR